MTWRRRATANGRLSAIQSDAPAPDRHVLYSVRLESGNASGAGGNPIHIPLHIVARRESSVLHEDVRHVHAARSLPKGIFDRFLNIALSEKRAARPLETSQERVRMATFVHPRRQDGEVPNLQTRRARRYCNGDGGDGYQRPKQQATTPAGRHRGPCRRSRHKSEDILRIHEIYVPKKTRVKDHPSRVDKVMCEREHPADQDALDLRSADGVHATHGANIARARCSCESAQARQDAIR